MALLAMAAYKDTPNKVLNNKKLGLGKKMQT